MKKVLYILLVLMVVSSCRKDESIINPTKVILFPPAESKVKTNLTGIVRFGNGSPLANVNVRVANEVYVTDECGYFFFNDLEVDASGFAVSLDRGEEINSIQRVVPNPNSDTYTEIVPLFHFPLNQISAEEGGIVGDSLDNIFIELPSFAFIDDSGNIFQGSVQSTISYIASGEQMQRVMPGNNEGFEISASGFPLENSVSLGSFGMFYVQFNSPNNRKLQLADGIKAKVSMLIDSDIVDLTPEEVPVWSLDNETGLWFQEGSATKDGENYTFEIDNKIYWNVAVPSQKVTLTGRVLYEGMPLENLAINILYREGLELVTRVGFTNSEGRYKGMVPQDKEFEVRIYDWNCNTLLYESVVDPLVASTNAIDFNISLPDVNSTTFTGLIFDCQEMPLANGLVLLKSENGLVLGSTVSGVDGAFSLTTYCSEGSFIIKGQDPTTLKESQEMFLENLGENQNVGTLSTCNEAGEYIIVKTDFGMTKFETPETVFVETEENVNFSDESGDGFVDFVIAPIAEGIANNMVFCQIQVNDSDWVCVGGLPNVLCVENMEVSISKYDGEIAVGSAKGRLFQGNVNDPNPDFSTEVEILFKVIIDN